MVFSKKKILAAPNHFSFAILLENLHLREIILLLTPDCQTQSNTMAHDYKSKPRDTFGSKFGIIAAVAGSAIGLGNIWKFPYMAGANGGSAFLLIYLVFLLILGVPAMMAEFTVGRKGRA